MVTDEKVYADALTRDRLGSGLIWLGVLIWVPFLLLRITGRDPSLFFYLPFHLLGVVGGSRLRAAARRQMNLVPSRRNLLRMLGHGLIFSGILVWAPYFYWKAVLHQPVEVLDFLPYHLAGVLGGVLLLGINFFFTRTWAPKD